MVGWMFIALLVIVLPFMALRSSRALGRMGSDKPSRSAVQFNTLAMLVVLLGVAVAVARKEGLVILPAWEPGWRDAVAFLAFLAVSLGMLLARIDRLSAAHRERLEMITMSDWRDPKQLALYAAVCIAAGIAEEIAYRGVLVQALEERTGSLVIAIVIASVAFGAAHSVQGWSGVVLTSLFAGLFHLVVLATGNLYTAMIGHAAYDLIAGIALSESLRRRRAAGARATD